MVKIYILKLEQGKYYVGKTNKEIEERFNEHLEGTGSMWTNIYKPIEIIETILNGDAYDEDKYTKIYMDKYGINNVRGGSYTSEILKEYQLKSLEDELCTSQNKCFRCLRFGHFANKCYATTNINGIKIDNKLCISNNKCFRCLRSGHFANKCYATTNINGIKIDDNDDNDNDDNDNDDNDDDNDDNDNNDNNDDMRECGAVDDILECDAVDDDVQNGMTICENGMMICDNMTTIWGNVIIVIKNLIRKVSSQS